jgi:hypothetical protein
MSVAPSLVASCSFCRIGIDRDDAAGAGDLGAVDRGHADAAAADHDHGLAGVTFAVFTTAP